MIDHHQIGAALPTRKGRWDVGPSTQRRPNTSFIRPANSLYLCPAGGGQVNNGRGRKAQKASCRYTMLAGLPKGRVHKQGNRDKPPTYSRGVE